MKQLHREQLALHHLDVYSFTCSSEAWSMSRSSQRPSILCWRLSDFKCAKDLIVLLYTVKQLHREQLVLHHLDVYLFTWRNYTGDRTNGNRTNGNRPRNRTNQGIPVLAKDLTVLLHIMWISSTENNWSSIILMSIRLHEGTRIHISCANAFYLSVIWQVQWHQSGTLAE